MRWALYHHTHGYYLQERNPIGPAGDFVTAPEHHPAFARLVGRRVISVLRRLRDPASSVVVEMGAGNGTLAAGILETLDMNLPGPPPPYWILEPFPIWRKRQQERLAPFGNRVCWLPDLDACPPFRGVFLSNELPDSFPVHRVIRRGDSMRELLVVHQGDGFAEVEEGPSTPALTDYFCRLGFLPAPDRKCEVCVGLAPWVRQVARRLRAGSFLTLDYGATAEELFLSGPPEGHLRACRGQAHGTPLAKPGSQDLTAWVDFTTLLRTGREEGLHLEAFTTQRRFLLAMGWEAERHHDRSGRRRALTDLVDPAQMGSTRVLELRREE